MGSISNHLFSRRQALRVSGSPLFRFNVAFESAISGLAMVRRSNDKTEVTLPDAEVDHRSRPGPKRALDA
jgi:hypothetical protein